MKKSGFTLIELIFVIVIIGVLAATAIPKFKDLKQNAEASNVIKVAKDAYGSIPSSYVNLVELEESYDATDIKLNYLVNISGRNWAIDTTTQNEQTATYTDPGDGAVATLTLDPSSRNIRLQIACTGFKDTKTEEKCNKILGGTYTSDTNTTF